jgi:hypothetical protein
VLAPVQPSFSSTHSDIDSYSLLGVQPDVTPLSTMTKFERKVRYGESLLLRGGVHA